mgnify:CR=1 FL=1
MTKKKTVNGTSQRNMALKSSKAVFKREREINGLLAKQNYSEAEPLIRAEYERLGVKDFGYSNLVSLAALNIKLERLAAAEAILFEAIDLEDQKPEAPELLFEAYISAKQFARAHKIVKLLLAHSPDDAKYKYWEILALCASAKLSDALEEKWNAYMEAYPQFADDTQLHSAMVTGFLSAGRVEDALRHVQKYDLENIFDGQTGQFIPSLYVQLDQPRKAIERLTEMDVRYPENKAWRWNRGLIRLAIGDLHDGWGDYKERWNWPDFPSPKRLLKLPEWTGQPLEGKGVVVSAEQGVGDQIMFGVVINGLIKSGAQRVRIEVQPKLMSLFTLWYPDCEIAEFDNDEELDAELEKCFDYHLPMGELAAYFFDTPEKITKFPRRVLRINDSERNQLIGNFAAKYRVIIGLGWRSHAIDSTRIAGYATVEFAEHIIKSLPKDIGFVVLQYKLTPEERRALEDYPNVLIPSVDFFDDIVAHGKYCGCCDLVVTAGIMVWQLAGLFSTPVITWGAKSNWPSLGFDNPPWFSGVNLVRGQNNYDRLSVAEVIIQKIKIALGSS